MFAKISEFRPPLAAAFNSRERLPSSTPTAAQTAG
jgi:hypothetical protein